MSFYGPVGYGYCGPIGWGRCAPPCGVACDPCGSAACAPCGGVACAPCGSGDCAIGTSTGDPIAPAANEDWQKKKTYSDPTPPNGSSSGLGEAGRPRTSVDNGLNSTGKTRELNTDGEKFEPATKIDETEEGGGALGGGSKSGSKSGKKGPDAPRIDDGSNTRKAPTINLDEKVAWRSAPTRTRIAARPQAVDARLVRLPAYPPSNWLPVESESKVASK